MSEIYLQFLYFVLLKYFCVKVSNGWHQFLFFCCVGFREIYINCSLTLRFYSFSNEIVKRINLVFCLKVYKYIFYLLMHYFNRFKCGSKGNIFLILFDSFHIGIQLIFLVSWTNYQHGLYMKQKNLFLFRLARQAWCKEWRTFWSWKYHKSSEISTRARWSLDPELWMNL